MMRGGAAVHYVLKRARYVWRRATQRWTRAVARYELKREIAGNKRPRIIVGASGRTDQGWIPTEIDTFNLLNSADWDRYFRPDSIDAMLAEHVWEHLTGHEALVAASMCFKYLTPRGYVRVAVPDGLHPDPEYLDNVRVGGSGPGAKDHKVLYTHGTLKRVFESAGFQVELYEYFDESGNFHFCDWDPGDGMIARSRRFDTRNQDGKLNYTSIVIDARKPGPSSEVETRPSVP